MTTDYEFAKCAHQSYKEEGGIPPEGWRVLDHFRPDEVKDYFGFSATFYVNDESRKGIVAFRGTELKSTFKAAKGTLVSDFALMLGMTPGIVEYAQDFYSRQAERGYDISFTGHSLGAALAELLALRNRLPAVTFDSPGCKPLVHEQPEYAQNYSDYITTYLAAPHPINTLHEHVGNLFTVSIPHLEMAAPVPVGRSASLFANTLSMFSATGDYVNATAATLQIFQNIKWILRQHSPGNMVDAFDASLGLPRDYKRIISWPAQLSTLDANFFDPYTNPAMAALEFIVNEEERITAMINMLPGYEVEDIQHGQILGAVGF